MSIFFIVIILVLYGFLKLNSAKIKGFVGEAKVNVHLKFLGTEYISLHDVLIRNSKGSTSQIDHLVLSEYGIFVIETKNYKGWIFGKENAENWMQIIFKEKHQFRNPIKQNWSHIYALKSVLGNFPNIRYYPIVVFSGKADLKEIESSVPVIYESELHTTIKNFSKEKCLSVEDVQHIQVLLESSNITGRQTKKAHIRSIRQSLYEKESKEAQFICPKCNAPLRLRKGKYGEFYGCSNYPRCRFTMKS